ncbi:MAG: hypothetical protein L0228_17035 [Planctomycetes bacterium]|nr:hypothetical protein [Planctomycetota bacterium]
MAKHFAGQWGTCRLLLHRSDPENPPHDPLTMGHVDELAEGLEPTTC